MCLLVEREGASGTHDSPKPAKVGGDHAEAVRQLLELQLPHAAVQRKCVQQDDRGAVAGVADVQRCLTGAELAVVASGVVGAVAARAGDGRGARLGVRRRLLRRGRRLPARCRLAARPGGAGSRGVGSRRACGSRRRRVPSSRGANAVGEPVTSAATSARDVQRQPQRTGNERAARGRDAPRSRARSAISMPKRVMPVSVLHNVMPRRDATFVPPPPVTDTRAFRSRAVR